MKTNNINAIEITEGHTKGFFFTKWSLFLKEGGTEYYIDGVGMNGGKIGYLKTRNSKTGKSDIKLVDKLPNSSFFTK